MSGPAPPSVAGHRAAQFCPNRGELLEQKLQCKLDAPLAATPQDRVAQADVRSRRNRIEAATPANRNGGTARCGCAVANAVGCSVRKKGWHQRIGKSGVIE